ncbi:MAG: hypothetical protein Q9M33_01250 [Robiginitomaculum sp.]|nr:hypothetical protein [Robiginitomaculum sp.]MDQ7076879.1 hypothetical protein [Robiginitomaculum sp.]
MRTPEAFGLFGAYAKCLGPIARDKPSFLRKDTIRCAPIAGGRINENSKTMILRRVISHFRQQEWTAIFLDFVIVVVGVFVGLQASNWNDARLREQTAQIYIERLREELAASKEDISQRLSYFRQTRTNALQALSALEQPPEALGEQFLVDIYQASQMLQREYGRDTYNEILSVGANNAISDIAVRKRLANFYRSIKAQISSLRDKTSYRELVRRNMPYNVQQAIRAACGDIVTTGKNGEPTLALPADCDPDLSPSDASLGVAAILDLNIRKDLVRQLSSLDSKLFAAQLVIDRTNLLDAYLLDIQK